MANGEGISRREMVFGGASLVFGGGAGYIAAIQQLADLQARTTVLERDMETAYSEIRKRDVWGERISAAETEIAKGIQRVDRIEDRWRDHRHEDQPLPERPRSP